MRRLLLFLDFAALLVVSLFVTPPTPAFAQTTCEPGAVIQRVALWNGTQANERVFPAGLTTDGRYLTFWGEVSNFIPDDTNGDIDTYLFDRWTCTAERLSVTSTGEDIPGLYLSNWTQTTSNGRYSLFTALLHYNPPATLGEYHVYLRDRWLGTTERITLGTEDIEESAVMSDDARYVYFTTMDEIDPALISEERLYLRDRWTGETVHIATTPEDHYSTWYRSFALQAVSADGRYLLLSSDVATLVPNDTNGKRDAFVYDRVTQTFRRISMSNGGEQGNGNTYVSTLTPDGRFALLYSHATNLVADDTNDSFDVFLVDLATEQIERVNVGTGGTQTGGFTDSAPYADVSDDGRYVTWNSSNDSIVPNDTNNNMDVFVHDRLTQRTTRVSVTADGEQIPFGFAAYISGDGRYIAYISEATNLVPGDTNNRFDTFIVDWQRLPGALPPTGTATPIAPTGVIAANQPTFTWNAVPGASWYYLWVSDWSGHVLDQWYDGWNICAGGVCSVTPPITLRGGGQRWWVQAWSSGGGYGAWSAETAFAVTPSTPTPLTPAGSTPSPVTFQWSAVSGGAWYYVWLSGEAGKVFDSWFESAAVCGASTCATTPITLPGGNYRWWVQAWNPEGGYSAWSGQTDFSVPLPLLPDLAPTVPAPESVPPEAPASP